MASHPDPSGLPKTFTEDDRNDVSVREVEKLGKEANGADKYCASKTLSEKGMLHCLFVCLIGVQRRVAAWAFYKEHKEEVNWDMVYILPAYVRSLRPCSRMGYWN